MINKTKTDCETTLCYYETATRPQFFHGMLLTDEHLRAEQDYHREALKRVNRNLWGSGIVSGLTVEKLKDLCIRINPGVALDCCGNLIEVCKCITLDLSKECEKNYGSDCPPRQQQGTTEPDLKIKKYLVLRYVERETDLEPVLTPDTDCEPSGGKSKCGASKVQEGYCIELWDKCPCPQDPGPLKDIITTLEEAAENQELGNRNRAATGGAAGGTAPPPPPPPGSGSGSPYQKDCTDLPLPYEGCGCCESAIGLAVLEINCTTKTITRTIECDCRHYVMSPRLMSWLFARLIPKDMSHEMGEVYSRLADKTSANFVAAGVNLLAYGERLTELEKSVTDPNKKTPAPARQAGALRARLTSKKPTATPKP